MRKSYRIEGIFTLKSPLSHIGETISNSSHLVQERIIQDDGSLAEVFVYSGNAWRGQLRDLMARYMLDKLGTDGEPARVGIDTFSLLFSGGKIGGAQVNDIAQARRMRAALPMLALLGGGVGNQILQGKLRVGNCYPLCREAMPVLPRDLRETAARIDYSDCTMTKEHSRRDDAKIEATREYLAAPIAGLLGDMSGGKKPKGKSDDAPPDQMRIRMELLNPGAKLATWISLDAATETELGCLVSGLHMWADAPHIGGQSARGYGLADLDYSIMDRSTGEIVTDFVRVADGRCLLSAPAEEAKASYDQHLRELYDAALIGNRDNILAMLEAPQ